MRCSRNTVNVLMSVSRMCSTGISKYFFIFCPFSIFNATLLLMLCICFDVHHVDISNSHHRIWSALSTPWPTQTMNPQTPPSPPQTVRRLFTLPASWQLQPMLIWVPTGTPLCSMSLIQDFRQPMATPTWGLICNKQSFLILTTLKA